MFTAIGFFLHPILYLPNAIPEAVRSVLYLSPFTYFLMCWQDIFFYGGIVRWSAWVITFVFAPLMFVFGARALRGLEGTFRRLPMSMVRDVAAAARPAGQPAGAPTIRRRRHRQVVQHVRTAVRFHEGGADRRRLSPQEGGAARHQLRHPRKGDRRDHRPQWRGQEHAAQDHCRDLEPDRWNGRRARTGVGNSRTGHRIQSGIFRTRERHPFRSDARNVRSRDTRKARQHRCVFRPSGRHRRAVSHLFERNAGPARVCGGGIDRCRRDHHRRGAFHRRCAICRAQPAAHP